MEVDGGLSTRPMHRTDQCSLLTANECSGAETQFNVEIKSATKDILTKKAIFASLLDGNLRRRIARGYSA